MPSKCLQCGVDIKLGRLCGDHAAAIATADDFTAEQILPSTVATPTAWLIDQWGATHGLEDGASVGRDPSSCSLAILHHTVSSMHAQFLKQADGWQLVDRGSLNGTFLCSLPIRESAIQNGDQLGFGDISLFFAGEIASESTPAAGPGRTVPSKQEDMLFTASLESETGVLALAQRPGGGIATLVTGPTLEFARLEFSLLMILVERRQQARHPDLAYVSSSELAESLAFRSHNADTDNVRELIRRVRKKFQASGIDHLIESRQGVGYRIAWSFRS